MIASMNMELSWLDQVLLERCELAFSWLLERLEVMLALVNERHCFSVLKVMPVWFFVLDSLSSSRRVRCALYSEWGERSVCHQLYPRCLRLKRTFGRRLHFHSEPEGWIPSDLVHHFDRSNSTPLAFSWIQNQFQTNFHIFTSDFEIKSPAFEFLLWFNQNRFLHTIWLSSKSVPQIYSWSTYTPESSYQIESNYLCRRSINSLLCQQVVWLLNRTTRFENCLWLNTRVISFQRT